MSKCTCICPTTEGSAVGQHVIVSDKVSFRSELIDIDGVKYMEVVFEGLKNRSIIKHIVQIAKRKKNKIYLYVVGANFKEGKLYFKLMDEQESGKTDEEMEDHSCKMLKNGIKMLSARWSRPYKSRKKNTGGNKGFHNQPAPSS